MAFVALDVLVFYFYGMRHKARPSLEKALAFFDARIAQKSWNNGDRLPTVAQLARAADVSIATMSIAIGELRKKSILDVRRNAGVFFGKAPEKVAVKTALPKPSKVQMIKEKISLDIVEGRLGDSEFLPRHKELAHRYGTSFHTLKRITDLLIKEKRIVPAHRGFKINLHTPPVSWRNIVLIQHPHMHNAFNWKFFRTFFQMFISSLEKECVARRIRLLGKMFTDHFDSCEDFTQTIGFIIWPDYFLQPALNQVTSELLRYNKPLIFINYSSAEYSLPKSRYIHLSSLSNQAAGEKLGQYFIDMGHKKICYISRFDDCWSQVRFTGLSQACSRLGPDAVKIAGVFLQDKENGAVNLTSSDIDKTEYLKNKLAKLLKQVKRIEASFPDPFSLDEIRSKLYEFIYITELQLLSIPLFRKALSQHKDATAWVCADDYLMIYGANEFCKEEHILIPKDISLAGFNNMLETFRYDLTSYDFNWQAIVGKMLDTILYPRKNKNDKENPVIEVEGFVATRGSTAKARKLNSS